MTEREAELIKKLEQKEEELRQAHQKIKLLEQKIDLLVRRIFGSQSEKVDPAQLEMLLFSEEERGKEQSGDKDPVAAEMWAPPKKQRVRENGERTPRLPEHLPVVEEVIDPVAVQAAPEEWRCIGQEISEQLDYEPAHFLRRRLIRRKYVSRAEKEAPPVIAPLPEVLQERAMAAPGLLAQIIVAKYCDHLPLYRQETIYRTRHGVQLPRQTMARWMGLCADWLKPIYQEIKGSILSGSYVQTDETPVRYLCPGHGKTKLGYLWTYNRPGGEVFYDWQTSRAAQCLKNIIPVEFEGTLQCDAYSAYGAFVRQREEEAKVVITLAGCMAHARRPFFEALEQAPRVAGWILRQFQHLYKIEANLRAARAGPRLRQAVRSSHSRIIHERLYRVFSRLKATKRYLPKSGMGQALDYALSHWAMLSVYLQDGRIEIDNNLVENAIRPTAVGKKNWLFFGEAGAGERSAILFTLIECCRRVEIDPYLYLRDVLTRLPRMTNWQIKDVTPAAWAAASRQAPAAQSGAA
ncbi:MAG: IS66 family transposase [Verrucomicrobiales bacterium]